MKDKEEKKLDRNLRLTFPNLDEKEYKEAKEILKNGGVISGSKFPDNFELRYNDIVNPPPKVEMMFEKAEGLIELGLIGNSNKIIIKNHGKS